MPWLGSGDFQKVKNNNSLEPKVFAQPTNGATNPANFTWQKTGRFVSLRVDASGALTGAGATGGGSAVSGTCWNSFALALPDSDALLVGAGGSN